MRVNPSVEKYNTFLTKPQECLAHSTDFTITLPILWPSLSCLFVTAKPFRVISWSRHRNFPYFAAPPLKKNEHPSALELELESRTTCKLQLQTLLQNTIWNRQRIIQARGLRLLPCATNQRFRGSNGVSLPLIHVRRWTGRYGAAHRHLRQAKQRYAGANGMSPQGFFYAALQA